MEYPIRINKYLLENSICSRREADRLITLGQVKINGKKAKLGQKVIKKDKVEIEGKAKAKIENKKYVIFNKPKGVVSHNPQQGEKDPNSFLPFHEKLSPIGRLDKASHGLMILSNDGLLVDKILNPKNEHEKEYEVEVDKWITPNFLKGMASGVKIERIKTKPTKIKKLSRKKFNLTLTEGKKHQIRRMCAALGYQIIDLKRIRIMDLKLEKLGTGKFKEIKKEDILGEK